MCLAKLTASKDDGKAFCDTCVLLRALWRHYQILFEGSNLKRELRYSAFSRHVRACVRYGVLRRPAENSEITANLIHGRRPICNS